MGRRERERDRPGLDEGTYVGEGAFEAFQRLSHAVVEGGTRMEQAYIDERAVATNLLNNIRIAIEECLPVISSKVQESFPNAPTGVYGVFLLERKGEKLYMTREGSFLHVAGDRRRLMNSREVVEARWSIREIAIALAEEMSANVDGQERKVRSVERMARKMTAVADLLDPEK